MFSIEAGRLKMAGATMNGHIQHNEQFCKLQIKAIILHKTAQLLVKSYHFCDELCIHQAYELIHLPFRKIKNPAPYY
jgi:hypothetical protein